MAPPGVRLSWTAVAPSAVRSLLQLQATELATHVCPSIPYAQTTMARSGRPRTWPATLLTRHHRLSFEHFALPPAIPFSSLHHFLTLSQASAQALKSFLRVELRLSSAISLRPMVKRNNSIACCAAQAAQRKLPCAAVALALGQPATAKLGGWR